MFDNDKNTNSWAPDLDDDLSGFDTKGELDRADGGHDALDDVWDDDLHVPPAAPAFDWGDDLDFELSLDATGDFPKATGAIPMVAATAQPQGKRKGGKHGAHATKPKSKREQKKEEKKRRIEEMPEHQLRSIRTRRVLIVVLLLILALAGALGYFGYQMYVTSQQQLGQLVNETDVDAVTAGGHETGDSGLMTQKTQVPPLTGLFGLTQDEAVEAIGHGATVTTTQDENEEGSAIKKRVTLELSEEPGDSKSGTPTVYLGLNGDGKVVMAGYSAATASLGYGTLSLQDIVSNEHVIERTLTDAGLIVEDGAAKLPEDPSEYQTYDSDGTTLVRESANFKGEAPDVGGTTYKWSGVLAYDYTAANASGNLADTVRQIYIYIEK